MRIRSSLLGRGAAASTTLAVLLALVSPPATAWEPGSGDFEQLIADADGHADAKEHADAVEDYAGAFESMPEDLRATEVGEFVVLAAGKSAIADFEERQDPASLEKARDVLRRFIEQAPATDAAAELLDQVEAALAESSAEPEVDPLLDPDPDIDSDPDPDPDTTDKPPRRGLAVGLIAGGGVGVLAGVGLIIAGARQVPWYEQKLADEGWTPDQVGYDREIASAERFRTIDLAIGGSLLAVGVGLGVGGAILLARSGRKTSSQATLAPSLGRQGAGLTLRYRF